MGNITKVPNGPLVKKKGPYAGSTLKSGGKIKKSANGTTTKKTTVKPSSEYITQEGKNYTTTKKVNTNNGPRYYQGISPNMEFARELASKKALKINDSIPKSKLSARALEMLNEKKNGGLIKRADGSYSKRGLWDNIRANKGSGKKPTKQMLQQEKKIKAKTKK